MGKRFKKWENLTICINHLLFSEWASVVQWLRALTLKHWISHRCGSSLAWDTYEMASSAPVCQVFLRVLRFSPTFD